ncbi:MAG: hypothetical protein VKK04_08425 [Synechococcales bacterium]|nr:hypothetical protein [Synechococcales bacterium]
MIVIKGMSQIATSRVISGMRSLKAVGRSHHLPTDRGRIQANLAHMVSSEARRQWRNQMWNDSQRKHP